MRDWTSFPPAEQRRLLRAVEHGLEFGFTPERHQIPPKGDWRVWLMMGGRGAGKTLAGAYWQVHRRMTRPGTRGAVIAPTYRDGRNVCIEGPSGLLRFIPPSELVAYKRTLGRVEFANGSLIDVYNAEKPERLRGPEYEDIWADEFAAWKRFETWDTAWPTLRASTDPRVVVTTTPRPVPYLRALLKRAGQDVIVSRASTFDNPHLTEVAVDYLRERYEGTRLGRQELYAELLEDIEGALWRREWIETPRVNEAPQLAVVAVGVDPAVSSSGEQGCIVVGTDKRAIYVIGDSSISGDPAVRTKAAIAAYHRFKADGIVAEVNNGGDYIKHAVWSYEADIPVREVHASRGKRPRAEPVAALYEQGRVHHVGYFPELEDELCSWAPGESESPNRLDALVWAITALTGIGQKRSQVIEYEPQPRRGISPL